MALTLFVVVASQIGQLSTYMDLLIKVIPIYIAFMIIMPIVSRIIAKRFKLDTGSGRALIFSGSTRNSLVVLPLALALPDEISTLVAAVIVTQTIVELAGELIYIRVVPNLLFRNNKPDPNLVVSKNGKLYDYGRSPCRATRQGGDVKMANQMALPASNNTHAKPDDEKAILCMGRMND